MPIQIGTKAHDFSEPTGLLSDCHRRIEMFLGSLQLVAEGIDSPLTKEARAALETALRYFKEAAPKHTADEEESLFPRLRQIHHPDVESALAALNALENEHRRAAALHAEVHSLGLLSLDRGHLPAQEARQFRRAINDLAVIYGEHIRMKTT
jgi:iron-sulfur cluster repair protein YtfE (RIC family)